MSGLELLIPAIGSAMSGAAATAGTAAASAGTLLSTVAPYAGLAGTAASAAGAVGAAQASKTAAKTEGMALKAQGAAERASAQREAEAVRRRTQLAASELRAKAATSGGGLTADTVGSLFENIYEQGGLEARRANYVGLDRAAGLSDQARAARLKAKAEYTGNMLDAAGTAAGNLYKMKNYG